MLVGSVDPTDSNLGKAVCIYVTTGYIIPTAMFSDKMSSGL